MFKTDLGLNVTVRNYRKLKDSHSLRVASNLTAVGALYYNHFLTDVLRVERDRYF